ncbi:MAG: CCA tRNA nucleotidyltransferase [Rhizobiales bacterium]|nr:CCA tRNA nucleotidyltransferase [Hyphomicrobiales bacterium]
MPDLMYNSSKLAWLNTTPVQTIFKLLSQNGGEGRIVGGAVRDYLLGVKIGDVDYCSTHTPNQVIELAKVNNIRYVESGIKYGTITLLIAGQNFEVTSLREDVKTDGRHAVVVYGVDFVKDAMRRDFTFNALYMSADGQIHDPLKTGIADVKQAKIKFIGNADQRIKEDYLRILRYFRFIARFGLNIDQTDYKQISALVGGLNQLSAERLLNEFTRIYSSEHIILALKMMEDCNIFQQLFKTNLELSIVEYIKDNELEFEDKWLVQLYATLPNLSVKQWVKTLKISNKQQKIVTSLKWDAGIVVLNTIQLAKLIYKNSKKIVMHNLIINAAKQNYNITKLRQKLNFVNQFNTPTFPVKGQDLLNIGFKPGAELGTCLKTLENLWLESQFILTKTNLLAKV